MLFKSDFQPLPENEEFKKNILMLKLNDDYKDAMIKYKRLKDKEEEQRLREGRKEKKEEKDETFISKMVNEMVETAKDKHGKVKTFEDYNERITKTQPE